MLEEGARQAACSRVCFPGEAWLCGVHMHASVLCTCCAMAQHELTSLLLHLAASPAAQVRVGVSIHHSVQSVALDTLVEHRLGGDASRVRDSMAARCKNPEHSVSTTGGGNDEVPCSSPPCSVLPHSL